MRIIVAEDEAVSLRRLEQVLTSLGHQPEAHADGFAAWQAFQREPASIVISDWEMPHLDGLELCRNIRGTPTADYTYFILVSAANTDEASSEKASDLEVDDFLIKPVRRDAIWRRLRVAERFLKFTREIQQLKSLMPICMYCRKVRDDSDYWQELEGYVQNHTGLGFSHGVCPACVERVKQEFRAGLGGGARS